MKRFEGTDALTRAKNEVLSRMNGCGDAGCYACSENNKAIELLVKIAQEEAGYEQSMREAKPPRR